MLSLSEIAREIRKKINISEGSMLTLVIMNLGIDPDSSYFIKPDKPAIDAIVDEHIILAAYNMKVCDNVYDLDNPADFPIVYKHMSVKDKDLSYNLTVYYRIS